MSCLALLGCTALMRANSLKHPLEFAEMGKMVNFKIHHMCGEKGGEKGKTTNRLCWLW